LLSVFWSRYESPPAAHILVSPPPTHSAIAASRCPPRTLEDRGVCIPVPVAKEQTASAELVPLQPGRPTQLTAYRLPVPGVARLVNLSEAEVPPRFRVEGQAVVVNVPEKTQLSSRDLGGLQTATVAGSDPAGGWLLLNVTTPSPSLVLLAGLAELMPNLVQGQPLPAGTLAVSSRTVWLAARQLLPGRVATPSAEAWQAQASVAVDIRNLLELRTSAAPRASTEP
jgi:hypothetical protein